MTITYEPKKVIVILGMIITCLLMANSVGIVSKYSFGSHRIALFDLDEEANIPTLYSAITLLLGAGLLTVIATAKKREEKREYLYWAGLAVIFLFLSVDEAAGIHENLTRPIRTALNTSGILYFAWVIPYGILVITLTIIYLRFLFSLDKRIRYLIVFAGIIYVAGALGGDIFGGYWSELHGPENITYALIVMGEESLEMVGILVFIFALMYYITSEFKDLVFRIGTLA